MSCDAPGCLNRSVNRSPKQQQLEEKIGRITFFKYPYHYPVLFQKWKDFVNKKDWMPTYDSRICSQHFEEKWFDKTQNLKFKRLKPYAYPTIPTIFIDNELKASFCQVPGCQSSESKIKFRLVRFPQAKDRKEFSRWVENIMNYPGATSEMIQKITPDSRVCVEHFEPDCFRVLNNKQILRYGSVPTLNLFGTPIHRNLFNDTPKIPVLERDDIDIPKCAVSFCPSRFFESKDTAFHPFPMDWAQNILWIQAAKPYNNDQKFEYLCSKHFKEECFESQLTRILKKGVVPSVFPHKKLKIPEIEEILLPNSSNSVSNLLESLSGPQTPDTKTNSPNIPNFPALNPLKRPSTSNITSEIPPKLIMLSKPPTNPPKKKLIIVKKNLNGNNEISLMSPDKKITFVPKNSIQIMSPKNANLNKLMHDKNCSKLSDSLGQCSCGAEGKINSKKPRASLEKNPTEPKIPKLTTKPLEKLIEPRRARKSEPMARTVEKSFELLMPAKDMEEMEMSQEPMILRNTLENTPKGSKGGKNKQKFVFLQGNDVKTRRKGGKKNSDIKNMDDIMFENNLDPNSEILPNLDSKVLDKVKNTNGKIVKTIPVPNSSVELSDNITTDKIMPKIKVKDFAISPINVAQNREPVPQNDPIQPPEPVSRRSRSATRKIDSSKKVAPPVEPPKPQGRIKVSENIFKKSPPKPQKKRGLEKIPKGSFCAPRCS